MKFHKKMKKLENKGKGDLYKRPPVLRPFTAKPTNRLKRAMQQQHSLKDLMRVEKLNFADEIISQDAKFDQENLTWEIEYEKENEK
jgi:hypothetical protein